MAATHRRESDNGPVAACASGGGSGRAEGVGFKLRDVHGAEGDRRSNGGIGLGSIGRAANFDSNGWQVIPAGGCVGLR